MSPGLVEGRKQQQVTRLLGCPHSMASHPQCTSPKRARRQLRCLLWPGLGSRHSCPVLFGRSKPLSPAHAQGTPLESDCQVICAHVLFLFFKVYLLGHLSGSVDKASGSWFQLRSRSHGFVGSAPRQALRWQHGTCLGFSVSFCSSPTHTVSVSL